MGALRRPDLPPGPRRELSDALHDLHHHAGWPSLRSLARDTGVSHTTVSTAMSTPALPAWGTLELLVEAMRGDTAHFHELWLAASDPGIATDGTGASPRIAGRRTELAALRRHLEAGAGLLLVTGEAGIGKTTLVSAAAGSADAVVILGRCLPLATEVPLMPVIDLLAGIHDIDDGLWLKEALVDTPPYVARSLARLIPQLGGDAPAPTGDEFSRQHLFTAVTKVVANLARLRRLGFLVEDLHWADPTTLDLFEHLVGHSVPVPVVGTWRTEDDATSRASLDWLARVRRSHEVVALGLGPLTRDETAEQLALLGAGPPDRLDSIHSRTLGQPLFTEQLAAHLDSEGTLPERLAELLDRRLDGLTDPAWAVLRTLGVSERPLAPVQLAAASALSSEQLTSQLRTLRTRRLVRRSSEEMVHLQHPLLAEAVQRRLVPGEGARVHRALAEVLGAGPEPPAAEVAGHWLRAGDVERELEWRVLAARRSAATFDWAQEAEHWLRVLDLWTQDLDRRDDLPITRPMAYLAAMDALNEALEWDRAAEMSDSAEAALGAVDDATRAELLYRAAEYRGAREGTAVGLAIIDEALELFARLPPSTGHLLALNRKRLLLVDHAQFDEAQDVVRTAVEVAGAVGDRRLRRHHVISLAWHQGLTGAVSSTTELLDQGRALIGDEVDPLGDIRSGVIATDVLLICGSPVDEIGEAARSGLEAARAWGIDNTLPMMLISNVATALLRAGRVAEAAALVDGSADRPPDPMRWPLDEVRAAVDLRRGRHDLGAERIHFVLREVCVGDEVDPELLCIAAEIDFWRGAPDVTLPRLLRDLQIIGRSAPVRLALPALVTAARAAIECARLGRPESAAQVAAVREELSRVSRRTGSHERDLQVRAHLSTAEAELAEGGGRGRVERWVRSASAWDALGRPHDAAYTRWRAAQVALGDHQGTLALRLLDRAARDAREHVPLSHAIGLAHASA